MNKNKVTQQNRQGNQKQVNSNGNQMNTQQSNSSNNKNYPNMNTSNKNNNRKSINIVSGRSGSIMIKPNAQNDNKKVGVIIDTQNQKKDIDLKIQKVAPSTSSKLIENQDQSADGSKKKIGIQKLFQGKKKLVSKNMQRASQMNTGTLFVREFLEKMTNAKGKVKNSEETKICVHKVDRVDRLRGITIIYPKYIIPCQSRFKVTWEVIVLFLIIYIAIFVPYQIGFDITISTLETIEYMIIAFFIIDIFISMRTTFYNEDGDEILEGKKIFFNYIQSVNFIVDIVSAVPIAEFFDQENEQIRLINLVKILRLLRLSRLLKLLSSDKIKYAAMFFKSFMAFMLVLHWLTCFWFLIMESDFQESSANFVNTWIPSNLRAIAESSNTDEDQGMKDFYNTNKTSQAEIYVFSLYSITMLILGGDIAPVNMKQSFALSFSCIIGQTSMAILFANISMLIFKMNQKKQEYTNCLDSLQNTMDTNNLNQELRSRVLEYFHYCWRKKKIFQPEISNFSDLSKTLERESLLIIHQEIVGNVPLFSGLEMSELLSIIQKLKTQIFMPNECVSRTNEISNEMYFISEGIIEQIYFKDVKDEKINLNNAVSYYVDTQGQEENANESKKSIQLQQQDPLQIMRQNQIEMAQQGESKKSRYSRRISQRIKVEGITNVLQKEREKYDRKSTKQLDLMMHGSMRKIKDNLTQTKLLKKGDYFLELSLINSMRVEADFTASVFCITECFSRKDFEELKQEFPGIEQRLSKGMDIYKQNKKTEVSKILQQNQVFKDFTLEEIEYLYLDYFQDHYLETNQIIFHQGQQMQKMHFIIKGRVNYAHSIIHQKDTGHQDFLTIDDDVQYFHDMNVFQYDETLLLKTVMSMKKGAFFGFINTHSQLSTKLISKNYYLTEEPTHVISIDQSIFQRLTDIDQIGLRDKLKNALQEIENANHDASKNIEQHLVKEHFIRVPNSHGDEIPDSEDEQHLDTDISKVAQNKKEKSAIVNKTLTKIINKMLKQQQNILQSMQKKAKDYQDIYRD